jgi:hypothetical protein
MDVKTKDVDTTIISSLGSVDLGDASAGMEAPSGETDRKEK